ncbi:unnamed protein product [Didymodactylos carnosus]|uniref:Uncharacterized protein n=1 Tax=Didymodactylos carnosus TaxID=1234261 RepID=A0A814MB55_9BILA|nr:unnamed protein product [Didymodactylos carnosus]CAF1077205.1 unnamed protein product [Didymodactylos carnosus]CAF3826899.1 unnamed protein product [Didymodactylos carnosus]CAF3843561.1 unnamed protein product [Didymodactylos carnosus]
MQMITNWIMNQDNNGILSSRKRTIVFILILALLVAYYVKSPPPPACDMEIAENRDFNSFYGITGLKNHFTTPTADECSPGIIFRPALPQTILKADNSASSFMTLAKYGTGKTLLRCEYFKCLAANNYLKISILNRQISEYLDRYVSGKNLTRKDCQNENCLIDWSENEFAQLIFSSLVTELIDTHHNTPLSFPDLSLHEKIHLITIICYYYNGVGTGNLEHFVNSFLGKRPDSPYLASEAKVQVQERNMFHDKPLLTHLKSDFKRFSILKNDNERLHLLLAILEEEKFEHEASSKHLYENVFRDLTRFSVFIKNSLNKTPVFVIDGIDENGYFFPQKRSE